MSVISRADLLKELLPGLNALFGLEYDKYGKAKWGETVEKPWEIEVEYEQTEND
jgi:hypothetical protein